MDKPRNWVAQFLPAVLQDESTPQFRAFLTAFTYVLRESPAEDPTWIGFEQVLRGVDRYFTFQAADPQQQTPDSFLPWLATWVALQQSTAVDLTRRELLAQLVPLYHKRGTKAGLLTILSIFLPKFRIDIDDHWDIGEDGVRVQAGRYLTNYFQVLLEYDASAQLSNDDLSQAKQTAKAILYLEKPAHTFFALRIKQST